MWLIGDFSIFSSLNIATFCLLTKPFEMKTVDVRSYCEYAAWYNGKHMLCLIYEMYQLPHAYCQTPVAVI